MSIYTYKSPKYKTLIELVLKPSKTYDARDVPNTHINRMEDTSDPPINKLTDIEWNQLKHEFISQYLKDLPSGMDHQLAHDNIIYDNIYMDIHPNVNILHDNMEEKPFIVSIQDRDLHNSHEEVTYNINWNVRENANMITTTTHTKDHTKLCLIKR
ncbi:hypothetical protein PFDG_04625 [Plasmodium falciparum Dd2]|uniref:Plasmodium falciparum erythrocyte membrane protein 1 acidic terminal segment domain-containing protein n=7 Tax=Plasmodium falciparum TaxID=5833 RepID=A0A0L7M5L8_PLAF4|nr:hypothetical protein PFDG_04625 [Plasmodium falciparum Dd2]